MIGYDGNKHVLGSKIHTIVAGESSLPINVILGPANEHDSRKLFALMNEINIATGAHRPKKRPKEAFADVAYDTFIPCKTLSFEKKGQSFDSKEK